MYKLFTDRIVFSSSSEFYFYCFAVKSWSVQKRDKIIQFCHPLLILEFVPNLYVFLSSVEHKRKSDQCRKIKMLIVVFG